jgi:hypothetical protein
VISVFNLASDEYDVEPTVNATVLMLADVIFVTIKPPVVGPLDAIWRLPVEPRYKPI